MRKVCLLGASGNIGTQSLDIFASDRKSFELKAISIGHQIDKIPAILASFPSITHLCVEEETDAIALRKSNPALKIYSGDEGLKDLIKESGCDMVENALVGFSGLVPSLTTLQLDKILCLANKESLVVGGDFIKRLLKAGTGKIYPIDSEHVALAKCLSKVNRADVKRFIVTASGGAFRDMTRDELKNVTPALALNHPTWKMGPKITIDSDTMMNKGFELIEAHYLFDWPIEDMMIVINEESEVHSALEMKDGTFYADVGKPDMHGPISYALYEGKIPFEVYSGHSLESFGPYHFRKFDPLRYPAVDIALRAYTHGGVSTTVLNAANEEADKLFLAGKISFVDIEPLCRLALHNIPNIMNPTLRDVLTSDAYTRLFIERKVASKK
jgi:1-deoxy-D-xylulose-5-phosphate reductoisomerase